MKKLTKRQLLEIRRKAHEEYLLNRTLRWWPRKWVSLTIEGPYAVVRTRDGITFKFPAEKLFERDALSQLGF